MCSTLSFLENSKSDSNDKEIDNESLSELVNKRKIHSADGSGFRAKSLEMKMATRMVQAP